MAKMNTFYFFLQGIPECMGITALSLAVARVQLRWGYIFLGALLLSVVSFVIRSLPVTFGFHLPVVIFLLFILMVRFTNLSPSRTIIAVFSSFVALALLEYTISGIFFAYSHIDAQQVIADERLWAALGVTQAIILNIIALAVSHFLKPTEGVWKR